VSAQERPALIPGWKSLIRDAVSLTFPWLIIFKQAGILFSPPAQVNEALLWLAGAMLGVPGLAQIFERLPGRGGTDPSPPPPASPESLPGTSSAEVSGVDA
jgi:hypothetical protein